MNLQQFRHIMFELLLCKLQSNIGFICKEKFYMKRADLHETNDPQN